MIISLLFVLVSLGLYWGAPMRFSDTYCYLLFLVFIANAGYLYWYDYKNEKIGFNPLFIVSMFLVTYLYPLFAYPIFPDFKVLGVPSFNYDVITRATGLANIAFSLYCLGFIAVLSLENFLNNHQFDKEAQDKKQLPQLLSNYQLLVFTCFTVLLFFAFTATGGLAFFRASYGSGDGPSSGAFSLVWVFFQTACILLLIANLKNNNKYIHCILLFIVLCLLMVGTRTLPLCLMIVAVYYYCNKYKLSLKSIVSIGVIGFIGLVIVGNLRIAASVDSSFYLEDQAGFLLSVIDFLFPNRNLYAIYDHVQKDDITYGVSSMAYILSVIPFSQSIFINTTDIPDYMLRSETMTTHWEFGSDMGWGLGTNIVGDVYLSFGLIGVIIAFFLLGCLVAKTRVLMYNQSWIGSVIYLILVSNSIFMCRGSFFYSFKNIIWSLLLIGFIKWFDQHFEIRWSKFSSDKTY